jgi:hypothetical protein
MIHSSPPHTRTLGFPVFFTSHLLAMELNTETIRVSLNHTLSTVGMCLPSDCIATVTAQIPQKASYVIATTAVV